MKNLKISTNPGSITIYNNKTKNVICEIWCSDKTSKKKIKLAVFIVNKLKDFK